MTPLALGLGICAAHAQETADAGFDAHGFRLVAHDGDLRDPLAVQRPGPFDQGDWFVSGLVEYAKAPLVRELDTGVGATSTVESVVDDLVVLNLSAGFAAHERLRFDVLAPVYGLSTGIDDAIYGPAMGDLRGSVMIVAVRPDPVAGGFGLGLVGQIDAPTGTPSRFLGTGGLAGGGRLSATVELDLATITADVGARFNPALDLENLGGSDTLVAGLGVGWLTSDTVGITLEANTQPAFEPFAAAGARDFPTLPPVEAILSVRYVDRSGGFWTAGAAGGITDGPGVAAFRLFVGGGYGTGVGLGLRDVDTVGVLRATDLCPLEPETHNGWKDEDGCPDRLGTLGVDVKFRGESRAADAEIVGPDGPETLRIGPQGLALDAVPGSQWTVRATDGCLTGEASAVATELGTKMIVDLQPIYDAKVHIEVFGPTGLPVPAALVAWKSDHPECAPLGTQTADAQGRLVQGVTAGTHRLVVTAPGHNVVEQPLDLSKGDDRVVRIDLAASKIVLDAKQIRLLEKIQFEFGKAVIRPESYGLLSEIASVILQVPGLGRVEVGGHTDNKGSDAFNLELSRDRAFAVREYLIAQGVPAAQLLAVGYGESRPIDTNKTEGGREVNRRVEFQLIDQQGQGARP